MILPSFITFSAGSILTAAQLNNFSTSGNFFLAVPVAEMRQTIAQSLTSGAVTAILFDTEDVDNDNGHSTSVNTSRYTGQTPGRFQFFGGVGFAAATTGRRLANWGKNGSTINASQSSEMPITTASVGTDHVARPITQLLNGTTDYVELFGLQETGSPLNTAVSGAAQPSMSVRWVGTT